MPTEYRLSVANKKNNVTTMKYKEKSKTSSQAHHCRKI